MPDDDEPTLPYPEPDDEGFTSGWSGSGASHDRAKRERDDGTTKHRQQTVPPTSSTPHRPTG